MSDWQGLSTAARGYLNVPLLARACARLLEVPSPSGSEAESASRLKPWLDALSERSLSWDIQQIGAGGANLIGWANADSWQECRGLWFYSHLDTSFTGVPSLDQMIVGNADLPPIDEDFERVVRGNGAVVAKGPTASAICAVLAISRAMSEFGVSEPLGVMLAAGGTHRAAPVPPPAHVPAGLMNGLGRGVKAAVEAGWRPEAVINTKAGPAGVLATEPGCLVLQVRISGTARPAAQRDDTPGGAVVAGFVAMELERWRKEYVDRFRDGRSEVAGEAVIGSVEAGLAFKCDFQPALANVYLYVVTPPGIDQDALIAEIGDRVRSTITAEFGGTWARDTDIVLLGAQPAGVTSQDAPIVRAARAAWHAHYGEGSSVVAGFRGATDGALLRHLGIDTARFGVPSTSFPGSQGSGEALATEDLFLAANLYVDTALRYYSDVAGRRKLTGRLAAQPAPALDSRPLEPEP